MYQGSGPRFESVELAAEGDEADVGPDTSHGGDAVGVQTCAVNKESSGDVTLGGVNSQVFRVGGDGQDSRVGMHFAARFLEESCIGLGDCVVVDDGRLRRVDGFDTIGVGFDFPESFGVNDLEAGDTVGSSSTVELFKGRDFRFLGGNDDLAAVLVCDAVLTAELLESRAPLTQFWAFREPVR